MRTARRAGDRLVKKLMLLGVLGLAACSNPAEDAEKEYATIAKLGTNTEKCQAAAKVTAAWLKQGDEGKLLSSRIRQQGVCFDAQLRP